MRFLEMCNYVLYFMHNVMKAKSNLIVSTSIEDIGHRINGMQELYQLQIGIAYRNLSY